MSNLLPRAVTTAAAGLALLDAAGKKFPLDLEVHNNHFDRSVEAETSTEVLPGQVAVARFVDAGQFARAVNGLIAIRALMGWASVEGDMPPGLSILLPADVVPAESTATADASAAATKTTKAKA
jgi:hypothetical protein